MLVYGAWAMGGVYPPLQWPLTSLSALLLGGLFFLEPKEVKKLVFRDPVFYMGLAFLLILVVQSLNSGYAVMWDRVDQVGLPVLPSKWIPWSVEPNTASQMFNWFFPAFTAILIVRHALSRELISLMLCVLVWNATVLAVVGLAQVTLGAEKILGLWEMPKWSGFFATFGYGNHAAAFFYLHATLAAGLGHQAIKRHEPIARLITWVVCFVLLLAGAFGSLSRAGGLAGLVIIVCVFACVIKWAWRRSKGNQIINLIGVGALVVLAGFIMYFSAGGGRLAAEIEDTFLGEGLQERVEDRAMQFPSALEIAKDWPVFGCGGWSYRWMALLHVPIEDWGRKWKDPGKANVHCDPIQFLGEFGFVGSLLLVGAVGYLTVGFLRPSKNLETPASSEAWPSINRGSALSNWMALGLFLIWLHAWIDLPFRCPVILITWSLLLAALPKLAQDPKHGYMLEEWE